MSDWDNPTPDSSEVPPGYTVSMLDLVNSLPDPDDDECEEDDDYTLSDEWNDDLGGGDISAVHCACNGNECNGASRSAAFAAAALMGAMVAVAAF